MQGKEDTLPHINVATATLLVVDQEDAGRVLLTQTHKHTLMVLPGGKIEKVDCLHNAMKDNARVAACRELQEELGCMPIEIEYFTTIEALNAEPRTMTASNFRGTIAESSVANLKDDDLVLAHYGTPDYLFKVRVNAEDLSVTEEVASFTFIDVHNYSRDIIDDAHVDYLERYRQCMKSKY